MIKINVHLNNTHWKKYIKNPNTYINKKINKINKKDKIYKKKIFSCSLLLSGSDQIKRLNKKFRKKNKSTDVLSFPFHTKKDLIKIIKKENDIYLGDIIVNFEKLKNRNDKIKFKREFDYLWIHGLLHLFGYKHKLIKDFKNMKKVEKKYFNYIN